MRNASKSGGDRRLVDQCLQGADAAWQRLYATYYPRLVHDGHRWLRCHGSLDDNPADEAAQRLFIALQARGRRLLRDYDPHRPLWPYLVGLYRRRLFTVVRERRRRQARAGPLPASPLLDRKADPMPLSLQIEELKEQMTSRQADYLQGLLGTDLGKRVSECMSAADRKRKQRLEEQARRYVQGETA